MQTKSVDGSATLRWFLFFLVLVAVAGGAGWRVLTRARRMRPADAAQLRFSAMVPGQDATGVVLVEAASQGRLSGILLERETDTRYHRTSAAVGAGIEAQLSPATNVAMGGTHDIVAGAVVQIEGTVDARHILQVRQAVILTGYVHVDKQTKGEK